MTDRSEALDERARIDARLELRRYAEASAMIARALARTPEDSALWCRLAVVQLALKDLDNALASAKRAMQTNPTHEWPHRLASIIYRESGMFKEAVGAARTSVSLAPLAWQPHVCLAQALLRETPDRTEARLEAARAVGLDPNRVEVHLVFGEVEVASGNPKGAEKAFRAALAIDPQSSIAHNELARVQMGAMTPLFGSSQLASAAGGFASAVQVDPRASGSRRNLELTAGTFVTRSAYLIFLVAVVGYGPLGTSTSLAARLAPLVLLLVPFGFSLRFCMRLTPELRRFLLLYAWQSWLRRVVVALEILGALLIASSACFESAPRKHLLQAGGACALAAAVIQFVMLLVQRSRGVTPPVSGRAAPPPRAVLGTGVTEQPPRAQHDYSRPPAMRSGYLVLLLVTLPMPMLAAFAFVVGPFPFGVRVGGGIALLVLVVSYAALVRSLRARSRHRSQHPRPAVNSERDRPLG